MKMREYVKIREKKRLFGTFGYRGLANKDLSPGVALSLGATLASYLGKGKTVVVAHDPRTSSEMFERALTTGLMSHGCNVKTVGLTPTPTLSFAIPYLKADAGIMISASHNPPEWNGIKFWNSDGSAFSPRQDLIIEDIYFGKKFLPASWEEIGNVEHIEKINDKYIEAIISRMNSEIIKQAGFKVVLDCGGGAASHVTPNLCKKLGFDVVYFNCIPDGFFKERPAEPRPENIGKLKELVKMHNADFGVAHDTDADRTVFVDERGNFISGDRTFALTCYYLLRNNPGSKIVANIVTSSVILDVAEKVKAEVLWSPIGEPYITEIMKDVRAKVGGEENGGTIIRDWVWAREGPYLVPLIAELMANTGKTLSELSKEFPEYAQLKINVYFPKEEYDKKKFEVLKLIEKKVSKCNYDKIVTIDGVKIFFGKEWLAIRPSGTEPLFRVITEARTEKRTKELNEQGVDIAKASFGEMGKG